MNYWKCNWRRGRESRQLARELFILLLQWISFLCVDAVLCFPFYFDRKEADSPYKVSSTWIMQKIWSHFTMKQHKLSKRPSLQWWGMEVSQYPLFLCFFFSTKMCLSWRSCSRHPAHSLFSLLSFFSFKGPVSAPVSKPYLSLSFDLSQEQEKFGRLTMKTFCKNGALAIILESSPDL